MLALNSQLGFFDLRLMVYWTMIIVEIKKDDLLSRVPSKSRDYPEGKSPG